MNSQVNSAPVDEFDRLVNPTSLDDAKVVAARMAKWAKEKGAACAFEVVLDSRKKFNVQPFGMHSLFKSHKLLHVEPIPA